MLTDPEGGEFCVFVREPDALTDHRLYELVIDAVDPKAIATWWSTVLGTEIGGQEDDQWWWLEEVLGMPFEGWSFVPVPEPKTVKNRIHWDVTVAAIDDLVRAGATVLRPQDDEIHWTVMADPEGNEFCAFVKD